MTDTDSPARARRFELPPGSEATEPPELRGLLRDGVRLLVARPEGVAHLRFGDLPGQLRAGDLVVVNTSATVPAALDAQLPGGGPVVVHVAGELDDGAWIVEVRRDDATGPVWTLRRGARLTLPGGATLELRTPYPDARSRGPTRLWTAKTDPKAHTDAWLHRYGRPVRYGYLRHLRPFADYQTVYASQPGSAEMPSAGRPLTAALLVRLMTLGITVAPVVLHTGLSSPEAHELPAPERFSVPEATARLVTSTRAAGGRVVAVGTTVVRAVETATSPDGITRAACGWTDLVLGPDRAARAVSGLVTGLHTPEASHLLLLDAVAGPQLVDAAYRGAVAERYLWHEFGDSMLLRP